MFMGHYAAGFALKGVEKKMSLGVLFLGVQFLDIVYYLLILAGIEDIAFIPYYTPSASVKMTFYPYSHGLLSVVIWSAGIYTLFRFVFLNNKAGSHPMALVAALAVFSHWLLDFLMHVPDLPLLGDTSYKLGLGIWNFPPVVSYATELLTLFIGLAVYIKLTPSAHRIGKTGMTVLVLMMAVINLVFFLPPAEHTKTEFVLQILPIYFIVTAAGFWLDKRTMQKRRG